jgi:hypothetical protein
MPNRTLRAAFNRAARCVNARTFARIGLSAAFLLATGATAQAANGSFTVSATVQAACFLNPQAPIQTATSGAEASGSIVEACNSGGYIVTANYRALAADESAVLQYGGETIALPASGQVVVHVSTMATVKQLTYALQSAHLDEPLSLSLSIQPT